MLTVSQVAGVVITHVAEEGMVQNALAAYRDARKGLVSEIYARNLLRSVGEKVPGGKWLILIASMPWVLDDEEIEMLTFRRQLELLGEAQLRLMRVQIELKELEIAQLKLELQHLG